MINNLYHNKNKEWTKEDIQDLRFIILPALKKRQPGYSVMHIARYFGRTQKAIKTMINKIEKLSCS